MNHPPCAWCGGPVVRSTHERPSHYQARTHCSRACGVSAFHAQQHAQLVDDVEWLLGTDTIYSIAHRLGYDNLASLRRRLQRLGRYDLAQHFDDRVVAA